MSRDQKYVIAFVILIIVLAIACSILVPGVSAQAIEPQHRIIMSEFGWTGTKANASDEWFELHNPTDETVVLYDYNNDGVGWYVQLLYPDGTSRNIDIPVTHIDPGGYAVFERTDDTALSSPAKGIYTGSLPNSGPVGVILVDGVALQDEWRFNGDVWPVGDNLNKASAAFDLESKEWRTSNYSNGVLDADGNLVWGTPGEENVWVEYGTHIHLPFIGG
jgi:hypothetical protein